MVIDMNEQQLNTVAQLRAFLNGTQEVQFELSGEDSKRYEFISSVKRLRYRRLARTDKGVVLRYLERTVGYSQQHLTCLVRRALRGEVLAKHYTSPTSGFARTFLAADVALLRPPWMAEGPLPRKPSAQRMKSNAGAVAEPTLTRCTDRRRSASCSAP